MNKIFSSIFSLLMIVALAFTTFAASPLNVKTEPFPKVGSDRSTVVASTIKSANTTKLRNNVIFENRDFEGFSAATNLKDKNLVRSAVFDQSITTASKRQFPPGANRKYGQRISTNDKLIPIKFSRFGTNKAREKI